VLYAAHAFWEELGIGPRLREKRHQDGGDAPHTAAWLALTANRLAGPASKLACDAHGLADDVYGPEAKTLALEHRYRAMDFWRRHSEAIEPALFLRTADRCNAAVDLLFWDTTTLSGEIDADDDDGEPWQTHAIPAWRQRGHHQEGRDGNPQVVVGLARTRDGLPVRSWGLPGHTAEVTTIDALKADVQGWRLHRAVVGGDRGRCAEANRQRLSRALGRYILAVPRRQVSAGPLAVLTRAGRSRHVADNLRVQEVYVGEGARRRRDVVGHNPDEAAREQAHREHLLELVRAELAALEGRQAAHPKNACERMASRRFGRDLRMDAGGRRSLDIPQVAAEAQDEGNLVVTTHDDTLEAEDGALGYTRMMWIEGCFRRMKTTGLQTRPIYHGRPHRIIAQVQRCVLALL
jgi:hypothetical protein